MQLYVYKFAKYWHLQLNTLQPYSLNTAYSLIPVKVLRKLS